MCNVVPRVLIQHWTKFFTCNVVWRLLDNIAQGFHLFTVVTRELKTTLNRIFSCGMLSGAQEQHCLEYLLVQCSPRSIKTTLNRIFSCAMLSGTSWATLHKVFTCAMLAHGWQTTFLSKKTHSYNIVSIKLDGATLHMNIVYSVLSKYVWDNIAQENYWYNNGPDHIVIYSLKYNHMHNVVLICLNQHCTRKFVVHFGPQPTNKFAQKK